MKIILTIISILIISFNSFGQPITPRANSSHTVQDSRFSAGLNLFVPRYADTTAANAGTSEGIDTLGAIIFTYSNMSLWVRSGSPKRWTAVGAGATANLIVRSAGTGIDTWYDSGDTLYIKKHKNTTFISTTTDTDSSLLIALSATGTPSNTTYLRGDNTWSTIAGGGNVSKVGTPVDNQVGVWTGDGTIEGDVDLVFDGANLGIGGTPLTKLDIWSGAAPGMVIGADLGAVTRTNATSKFGRIAGAHYTNSEEPVSLFSYSASSTTNTINYGLGATGMNGVNTHEFYTVVNNTTLSGTSRMILNNTLLQINNGLADYDVLIGGDTDANLFRTDASVDRVLIGTAAGSGTEKLSVTGNVALLVAGNKLKIATGSNASIGVSGAMTAGTITISTTAVTSSSIIMLVHATLGGTQGILSVGTITNGTSFVINSSSATDTGTVNWWIIN